MRKSLAARSVALVLGMGAVAMSSAIDHYNLVRLPDQGYGNVATGITSSPYFVSGSTQLGDGSVHPVYWTSADGSVFQENSLPVPTGAGGGIATNTWAGHGVQKFSGFVEEITGPWPVIWTVSSTGAPTFLIGLLRGQALGEYLLPAVQDGAVGWVLAGESRHAAIFTPNSATGHLDSLDLGTLGGHESTARTSVQGGQVVLGSAQNAAGVWRACAWKKQQNGSWLATDYGPDAAHGGALVGGSQTSPYIVGNLTGPTGPWVAGFWNNSSPFQALPHDGLATTLAESVLCDGSVFIGGRAAASSTAAPAAEVWRSLGNVNTFGQLRANLLLGSTDVLVQDIFGVARNEAMAAEGIGREHHPIGVALVPDGGRLPDFLYPSIYQHGLLPALFMMGDGSVNVAAHAAAGPPSASMDVSFYRPTLPNTNWSAKFFVRSRGVDAHEARWSQIILAYNWQKQVFVPISNTSIGQDFLNQSFLSLLPAVQYGNPETGEFKFRFMWSQIAGPASSWSIDVDTFVALAH